MIKIENISKCFGENFVFTDFSLTINNGDKIAIMGESGSGKTTLLRMIAMLDEPTSGHIKITDCQTIAFSFQESRLFEHMTILDNVAVALPLPIKEARKNAADILEKVGLADSIGLYPSEVSGGMAQRVSLARALLRNADILLLDEPFSALDLETKEQMIRIVSQLTEGKTLILVTHSAEDAEKLCGKTVYI